MVPLPCPSCEGGFGLVVSRSCGHLQAAECSLIQPYWKEDQFASPQYGNIVKRDPQLLSKASF